MLELYFIFYRVPKMMTQLARERHRSALAWSLLGVGTWIGVELFVFVSCGMLYGIGVALFDLPMPIPAGIKIVVYIVALVSALLAVTYVSRILTRKSNRRFYRSPPPPPDFGSESDRAI